MTPSETSPEIPTVPADGRWKHVDGHIYVLRVVALLMGFTPPFLVKYRKKAHPALDRQIATITKEFRRQQSNGVWVCSYELYALNDLEQILAARRQAASVHSDGRLTLREAAGKTGRKAGALAHEIERGNISCEFVVEPRTIRTELKGKTTTFVLFRKVRRVHPDDLARPLPGDNGKVPLPEAARRSGISLHMWHHFTQNANPLLGHKLVTTECRGITAHGHYRKMDCITVAEYETVVARWEEAKAGRSRRPDGTYISPVVADREFDLGVPGRPPAMVLNDRKWRPSPILDRPILTVEGHYLGPNGKLIHGQLFFEADVALLFKRKRPAPPAVPAAQSFQSAVSDDDRWADVGGMSSAKKVGESTPAVVLGEQGAPATVRGIDKPPLPPGQYRVVQALHQAFPAGLLKDDLATKANYAEPHKVLKELCESDPDWDSAIERPGRGYRGGYRIRPL